MKKSKPQVIIGIGASAGGLEALKEFINSVVPNDYFSYVVAQHLSPSHKSMLATLLAKDSKIKVKELQDKEEVLSDHVYITPPNYNVVVQDGVFSLISPTNFVGPKPSIDLFLKSMADNYQTKCCAVILSGTGSDGTIGVRAVKASGGITIAQSPDKAKYDGMPKSAIETGDIDIVSESENIYKELKDIFIDKRPLHFEESEVSAQDESYSKIIKMISKRFKVDFNGYKENTIDRRIRRRMAALKIDSYPDYLKYLQENSEEIGGLFKDLLISVTSFYRDKDAFTKMQQLMKEKYKNKVPDTIRIWVVACATGEEAYSLAMLLTEALGSNISSVDVQIFATDIDYSGLNIARKGLYSEAAIADMDPAIVEKYFRRSGNNYEVKKSIREMVIFSRHDITNDPPFLRIDILTCRNLLIYFKPELQKEVLNKFYYSINPKGLLFLGKSETIGELSTMIRTVDSKLRIYEISNSDSRLRRMHVNEYGGLKHPSQNTPADRNRFSIDKYLNEQGICDFLERFIIIDENYTLYYIHGSVDEFMEISIGTFKSNIMNMFNKSLRAELRGLMQAVSETDEVVEGAFKSFDNGKNPLYFRLKIKKVKHEQKETGFFIVVIETLAKDRMPSLMKIEQKNKDEIYNQIELELNSTREHLQTVIEELETSNEELQSLNEELQSSNEELQSSNEELETTNEELQATNEELSTAYVELKQVNEEKDRDQRLLAEKSTALERYKNDLLELNQQLENRIKEEVKHRLEKEIYVSEIFNTANVGICVTNSKGYFTEVNDAYLTLYGYEREELIGEHFSIVVPRDFRSIANKMHEDFILGLTDEVPTEWEVVRKDGELIKIVTTASRTSLQNEYHKITSVTDITQLKKLQDEKRMQEHMLVQQSKFAAMGEMVAAISHQWKQPINSLSMIFQNFQLMKSEDFVDAEEINEFSNTGLQMIKFMNDTIDSFRDFYSLNNSSTDINSVEQVRNTLTILSAKIHSNNINVVFKVKHSGRKFESINYESVEQSFGHYFSDFSISDYSNDFQQVVLALASNAIDAVEERTASKKDSLRNVTINLSSKDSKLQMDIYDNGNGIPEKIKNKIFEPYFTTKDKEKGTGVGLYLVKQIVESRFNGEISCSNTRHGAKFTVVIPRFG
jgi:PAS domain S-box-containing protein